jgi:hypothetical protein
MNDISKNIVGEKEIASLVYHDIFDYPLNLRDLVRWQAGRKVKNLPARLDSAKRAGRKDIKHIVYSYEYRDGYYFIKDREGLILKSLLKKRISAKKMKLALKRANLLKHIPTIRMLAVSGALAMENSNEESDIDFIIITQKGTLWTSRLICLILLKTLGIPVRRHGEKIQRDKLCLNMWFDESNLIWSKKNRNIYTAHEILQIKPLVNKDKTYEKFIAKNSWAKDYWPNAVRVRSTKGIVHSSSYLCTMFYVLCTAIFERPAYLLQKLYMRKKKTREVVTKTRAIFHPIDLSEIVLSKLR